MIYSMNYADPKGPLVYDQTHLGVGGQELLSALDRRDIRIHDGRTKDTDFSLDTQGFELTEVDFSFGNFTDDHAVKSQLYPQVETWIKQHLGGINTVKDVRIFDHTVRSNSQGSATVHRRAPVKTVHNDFTHRSAQYRVEQETKDEPSLQHLRYQFINLWMPILHTVEESPLAMVDMTTTEEADFHQLKLIYPDRVGEIAAISYNPDHRWYFFPNMTPSEAILLKVYDKSSLGALSGVPHSAVDDPATLANARLRTSIEIRTIVFFED